MSRVEGISGKIEQEGKLERKYLDYYEELNKLWKEAEHGKRKIDIDELKKGFELAKSLVEKFKKLIHESE